MSKEFKNLVEEKWEEYQNVTPEYIKKQCLGNPVSKACTKFGVMLGCTYLMYPKRAIAVTTLVVGAVAGAIVYNINQD
jgi:hypothetical protein